MPIAVGLIDDQRIEKNHETPISNGFVRVELPTSDDERAWRRHD